MIATGARVRTVLAEAAARLHAAGIREADLDAELLLAHLLERPRLSLHLEDRELTEAQLGGFRTLVERRVAREPLQYIVGSVSFREIELRVDRRALIPRPETEVLVGVVLDHARSGDAPVGAALDIGTGTGAIALSLLAEGGYDFMVATDVSGDALSLARENAERLALLPRLDLRAGSLWDAVRPDERFAAVVSNPPYIALAERNRLEPEVVTWEPAAALFSGGTGLDAIREIVAGSAARLMAGGLLALEIGAAQAGIVRGLMEAEPDLVDPAITNDWAGRPRIATARRR